MHSLRTHGLLMRILITNDDGIESPGLWALVDAFRPDHDVLVVAPDRNRSGVAHSITTTSALTLQRRTHDSVQAYACSGTPADCVVLGTAELSPEGIDLIISGINRGPNLADDVNYSGTVAGAIESSLLGIPAIAASLGVNPEATDAVCHWASAAQIVRICAARMHESIPDSSVYWNVNVPNRPADAIRGIAVTRLGRKRVCDRILGEEDGGARRYYRLWESPFETHTTAVDTDIAAVEAGYASITPLTLDRTAHDQLAKLAERLRAPGFTEAP